MTFSTLQVLSQSGHSNIIPAIFHVPSTTPKWKYLTFPNTSLDILGMAL